MISALRDLPISFKGELHDVKLIQFSIDPEEAQAHANSQLTPRLFNGRAIVSMVDVHLKRMRPALLPSQLGISYRHIGFRLLIADRLYTGDSTKHGIFFVQSFTDRFLVTLPAQLLTYYQLKFSQIESKAGEVSVREDRGSLSYGIGGGSPALSGSAFSSWEEAKDTVGGIDRAFAINGKGKVVVTKIVRPEWPITPINLKHFTTSFFRSAKRECAFQVSKPIPYQWLAPIVVGGQ